MDHGESICTTEIRKHCTSEVFVCLFVCFFPSGIQLSDIHQQVTASISDIGREQGEGIVESESQKREREQEIMEPAKMYNKRKFQSNNFASVLRSVSTKLIPANSMRPGTLQSPWHLLFLLPSYRISLHVLSSVMSSSLQPCGL